MSEDKWGDLYCLYKACQSAMVEAYSETLALMNEVKMNDRVKMIVR